MPKFYKSNFYKEPIELEDIEGEKILTIKDNKNREAIYSWYDTIEQNTESFYINKCLLGGFIKKIPESVLIIGFGAGAFGKYLEDHISRVKISGIEIDETMIDIAKNEFGIKTKDLYISKTDEALGKIIGKNKKYDLILIDVYGSDGEIPDYFEKNDFFEKLKLVLKTDGTISINYSNFNSEYLNRLSKYNSIHSKFLKYFSENYSFIIEGEEEKGNKIGIYNLNKNHTKEEYISEYLKNVEKKEIIYDKKILYDFIVQKN